MKKSVLGIALAATAMLGANAAHAALPTGFTVKIEAPGDVESSANFDYFGVETFDNPDLLGLGSFDSDFGGSPITGTYNNVNVIKHNQYGGADAEGQYAVAGINVNQSYSIDFAAENGGGINYFGYWLSALDSGNTVQFWSGADLLGTFTPDDVLALVGPTGSNYLGGAYYSNPFTHENKGEPYVFVNFFLDDPNGSFDRIVFTQTKTGAGYESDNHTVGWYKDTGDGTVVPGVPEPSTWLTMIAGFGMVGYAVRRRKQNVATTVA